MCCEPHDNPKTYKPNTPSGFGSCIAFSSYNPPKTNFYKHALGISVVNSVTSLFAGVTIFAIVGSNAYKNEVSIDKVSILIPSSNFKT